MTASVLPLTCRKLRNPQFSLCQKNRVKVSASHIDLGGLSEVMCGKNLVLLAVSCGFVN